jgi:UDPglucose--hexose-1-phosphate uridylyltransferase
LKRPWRGETTEFPDTAREAYDPSCYLCPGNKRANGHTNPEYRNTYVFTNDYPALREVEPSIAENHNDLLVAKAESGICRVVNFSPRHDLTLAEMSESEIENVIAVWRDELLSLRCHPRINYLQIFENKGSMMGNSNPHPHGQIWAQESIPMEPRKELGQFKRYYAKTKRTILADYLKLELQLKERIVYENDSMAVVVPFWAVWPFETMIISKRKTRNVLQLRKTETRDFANAISVTTIKYDNLFETSFPYSAGLHQAPTDGKEHKEWHFHMHFYPPLLRSASIKKFLVGYELLAEPQRDITPELSARVLKELPVIHYKGSEKLRNESMSAKTRAQISQETSARPREHVL